MTGFTLAAAASVAVGLSIGAATTVGVTLAVDDHSRRRRSGPRHPHRTWCNTATGVITGIA